MMQLKHLLLATTIVAGSGLGLATMAEARQVAGKGEAPTVQTDKPHAKPTEPEAVEAVVVTGSRIRRSDFNSASPVTIITNEDAELKGSTSAVDMLQTLPQAANSQQINSQLGGYVVTGGPGAQTLGLRGLDASRTLILLNGRRLGPAGVGGTVSAVDLGVLPQASLSQIEILRNGASSIYGSDAIAGVVNYITKTNQDGLTLTARTTLPEHGSGENYYVGGSYGKSLAKGYVTGSLSYMEQRELTKGDRDYTACDADYYFNPKDNGRADLIGPGGGPVCFNHYNGVVVPKAYYGGVFQYDPKLQNYPAYPAAALGLRSFLPDWVRAARAGQKDTYKYLQSKPAIDSRASVVTPRTVLSGLFNVGYDVTPTTSAYGEFLFNRRTTKWHSSAELFPQIDPTNPNNTLAKGLQTACGFVGYQGAIPVCNVGGVPTAGTDGQVYPIIVWPQWSSTKVDYAHAVLGLKGTVKGLGFLDGFKWDGYYQYSGSRGSYAQKFVYKDRVIATTGIDDSGARVSNGQTCNQALITMAPTTCVSVPWLDPRVLQGQFTPEESNFLFGQETGHTRYDRHAFEFTLSGDVLKLPAGPLSTVVGVYAKRDSIKDTPGANAILRNYWGRTTAGVTQGTENLKEVYGEALVPVVKNLFLAKSVDLSLSGRLSDYDAFGTSKTYKVGVDWALSSQYRLRGSIGTSFRAPTLYERFLADSTGFFSGQDPCRLWKDSSNATLQQRCKADGIPDDYAGYIATPTVSTGGGKNLKPETSKTFSIGAVWTPSIIDLKVAVDYFELSIDQQIDNFGAGNILSSCYTAVDANKIFCDLFKRDPVSKDILTIRDDYLNINKQKLRGIDLNTRYTRNFTAGVLAIESQATWQLEYARSIKGEPFVDFVGRVNVPQFTAGVNTSFKAGDSTYFWSVDVVGRQSDSRGFETGEFAPGPFANYPEGYRRKLHVEQVVYHTISYRRRVNDWTLWAGVNNLFDEVPPAVSSDERGRVGTSAIGNYDFLGRRFFLQVERKF
jgi:iron complex outermembrane receptor protein